jgi:hypothetical protein
MPYNQPGGTHNGGYGTAGGGGRSGGNGNKGLPASAFSRPAPRTSQVASQAAAIAGKNPMANNRAAQVDSFFSGAPGYQGTNFSKAVKDFQDQGIANKALDFFTGIHELNPVDAWNGTANASWGIDPLGTALGLGGMAAGIPGLGTAYSGLKHLIGFKGPQMAFSGQPTGYSGYSAPGIATASGSRPGMGGGNGGNGNNGLGQMAQRPAMAPQPPAQAAPMAQPPRMSFMPARTLQSPLANYSSFRPGYSFMGPR